MQSSRASDMEARIKAAERQKENSEGNKIVTFYRLKVETAAIESPS
jgi:hypothetical protein